MRALLGSFRDKAVLTFSLLVVACSDSVGPPSACTVADVTTTIQLGQTLSASHSGSDCLLDGSAADGWRFTVTSSTVVVFEVPEGSRHRVGVSDAGFNWLVGLGSEFGQEQVSVPLIPGEYIVWVAAGPYGTRGAYQLSAQFLHTPPCAVSAGTVAMGQVVTGALAPGDCEFPLGYHRDSWQFSLASETTVRLDVTSDGLDLYMILTTSAGQWLDFDDNSGIGNNPRLGITLPAGEYAIVVTAFAYGYGATGDYALEVQPASAPTP